MLKMKEAVNWFYIFIILSLPGSFVLLWFLNKFELFPATLVSVVALVFAYHAYKFSKEKFRLDLFEKRFEIYEKVLEFCSIVLKYGSLRQNRDNQEEIIKAFQVAHESFRGIGLHKARALFGEDIHMEFQKLNQSFAWLVAMDNPQTGEGNRQQWANDMGKHLSFVIEIVDKLPGLFGPYIYFGDYKK